MSAPHTPGPWTFVQGGSGNFPTWNVRIGSNLVTLPSAASMETLDADARLIAAAPDLLALAYQYASDLQYPPVADSLKRRLDAIESVIAKLEGR